MTGRDWDGKEKQRTDGEPSNKFYYFIWGLGAGTLIGMALVWIFGA